MRFKFLIL